MWTIFKVFIEFVTVLLLFVLGFLATEAWGILASGPGIKPLPSAVEAWNLNCWTTKVVPDNMSLYIDE